MKNGFHILPASRLSRVTAACVQGLAASLASLAAPATAAPPASAQEHREFDAMLEAAFPAPPAGQARTFILHFTLPGARPAQGGAWQLSLHRPDGRLLRQWRGRHAARQGSGRVQIAWRADAGLPSGIYELRLQAGDIRQRRPIAVGQPALLLAASAAPPAPGTAGAPGPAQLAGLPYTILYGNLHSQTNHSDGGGDPARCNGAQAPQSAPFGPDDAFQFAQRHGLQVLLASEHNHMYDGSESSAPGADPLAARQLYRIGLASAASYSAAHPGFTALYGQEWGVISGGGHINILNSPALLGWERSSDGQPFADVVTPRNDYAALYKIMHEQGWLGQFNHPKESQFPIAGQALAYSQDGGAAMALCEIMNSHAFSSRIDEGETRHSYYESACNRLLEAGYQLAFSSNQDNHCANWGAAYGNRTGILLPAADRQSQDSVLAAIRARRVFATMDKHSAIALSANGAIMGSEIENSGPLALQVHYASSAGRGIAALDIMHGVPGRRGEVAALPGVAGLQHRFTPAPGRHFYYARITQDDGRQLWSAPVWVNQR
ncbi:CehA/McbA family metallohydrolase [Pseudoduganella sp.]|uniref:CehA/McbA family metallohydrolase n=1 Tax=Pseudoduganella sp. TaxID=1880898 RepID=UPI0035AE5360